jgi:photosystem II stability/assembly factor-like uncharacterized protein
MLMAETKVYEEGGFRIELTPQGDPHRGTLVTRFPEMAPYAAEVDLSKKRSRSEYANDAAEVWGVEEGSELTKDLKRALNAVHVRRLEEVAAAREAEQEEVESTEAHPEVSEVEIAELVGEPGVLDRLVEDSAAFSGVVGERPMLKLISLCALSAQLDLLPNGKPVAANLMLTATPGRGKNYLFDAVARVLPDSFYYSFESSSAKSFYYAAENNPVVLKHRWVYPNEAEATDQVVELLRPLLSGGRARHNTVNKDDRGRLVWQEFTIEGPSVLTIATVRNKIDPQLRAVYAGTEPSSLFVSRDGGTSWRELEGLKNLPSAPTWSFPPRPWTSHVRSIAISFEDPDLIVAGIELGGVVRSEDGGKSWQDQRPGAYADCHSLSTHAAAPNTIYEAAGGGFAQSEDFGDNWVAADEGLAQRYVWGLAVDREDLALLYVSAATGPGQVHGRGSSDAAIYRRSGARQWEPVLEHLNEFPYALAADPERSGALYAGLGDGTILCSSDTGTSWTELARAPGLNALAVIPA